MDVTVETPKADDIGATPSGSRDLSKTLPEEAFNHFLQGKRHMLVEDYTFAVQSLGQACELYVEHYGQLALECAEVQFLYGKALVRLCQQNAVVFGNALNEEEEEKSSDDEEEQEDEEEKNEDANGEKSEADGESAENTADDADEKELSEPTDSPQEVPVEDGKTEDKEESSGKSEAKEEAKGGEESTDASKEAANEPAQVEEEQQQTDDLELAWESLETAKTIFSRQGPDNRESQLKVAEILQILAEISMESANNAQAISDLEECLTIQTKYLEPDNRCLAETYYSKGLAHLLEKEYKAALGDFNTTVDILELRVRNLRAAPLQETAGSFEKADREKEIEEIEGVLADIREKIEDTVELPKEAEKELKEALLTKEIESPLKSNQTPGCSNNDKPVSNITHLLKRKKPEQEDTLSDAKRLKPSPSKMPNGESTT